MKSMGLVESYRKLFEEPGYSFIYTEHGCCVDWSSVYMKEKGFSLSKRTRMHLVPGSFNPLHETHKEIYSLIDAPAEESFFEMSVERVDKAMVSIDELDERLKQFIGLSPVVVSRAPRFVTKIGTYLSHINYLSFHVGIDTIVRMADDYGVFGIQGLAATFIVHDRIMDGKHLSLQTEFADYIPRNCEPSPILRNEESLSRSSSAIRKNMVDSL